MAGAGACAPDVAVLCLPCTTDDDCALRLPGARCLATGSGQNRCGQPCTGAGDCPAGFRCEGGTGDVSAQCVPESGWCGCSDATMGTEIACLYDGGDSHQCAGVQTCGPDGPSACMPVLAEACNGIDDDCDGHVDEDFRDDAGRYVSPTACGACGVPCAAPGPHMVATCLPAGTSARCDIQCEMGYVDVNGIAADGCECRRYDGTGPPPAVGGDANCDGVPDDTSDFIYVTTTGSDTNPGTLAHPMRTIEAAMRRGRTTSKDVLVARGIYDGPFDLIGGVNVYGGYAPDFRDRDLSLYPVLIERTDLPPGSPVMTCHGVTAPTRVEGFVLQGTDAVTPGDGSTAAYFDGCTSAVQLASIQVFAGRGADGGRGNASSDNLRALGLMSLDQLAGTDGTDGQDSPAGGTCTAVPGGAGGAMRCPDGDVSGGVGGAGGCPATRCTNGRPCGNGGCTDYTSGGVCDFMSVLRDAVPNQPAGSGHGPMGGAEGELTYNAPTDRGICNFCDDNPTLPRNGGTGGDGTSGTSGRGGMGCMAGPSLDATTGRIDGGGGTDGTSGTDGSGGGGGTAGAGYAVIGGTSGGCSDVAGGGGGGGGSGGCGAPGASGGGGGGMSTGMVVRLAPGASAGPGLTDVRIVTASGGSGGDGGLGATGGGGGGGGLGGQARFWCARTGGRGGDGGRGGAGGGGGGGCGGGSHGVVVVSRGGDPSAYATALRAGATIDRTGVAGRGGTGGFSPGAAGTGGQPGTADPVAVLP